jgi:hypothetical protein
MTFQEKRKCLTAEKAARSSLSKVEKRIYVNESFFGKESSWLPTSLCLLLQNGT